MNILNLPSLDVTSVEQGKTEYIIHAETISGPVFCPHCFTNNLYAHGKNRQEFRDFSLHGKVVTIVLSRQRYKCRDCGKTFMEDLTEMDERRLMTKRLIQHIPGQCFKKPFTGIADEIGVDEKTIRNVFIDYVKKCEEKADLATPEWLGIDEVKIGSAARCVLTNVGKRTIIDMLASRKQDAVSKWMMKLPDRKRIEIVCMDMWKPYKEVSKALLPGAQIVVDKFHVVRMANNGLDTVRKQIRDSQTATQRRALMRDRFVLLKRGKNLDEKDKLLLDVWTKNFPLLGQAYRLKEDFYDIWDTSKTRDDANLRYNEWRKQIPDELGGNFIELTRAVENWRDEIFAYFDTRATNAYTESLNNLIRFIDRQGRGYSFEVIRAKIMFGSVHIKEDRPRSSRLPTGVQELVFLRKPGGVVVVDYGAEISILLEDMVQGEFWSNSTD